MGKKIKQIDVNEALELAKNNSEVFVLTVSKKPIVKSFNNMAISEIFKDKADYIFFVFEEA